jgi:hypothetical protein
MIAVFIKIQKDRREVFKLHSKTLSLKAQIKHSYQE